MLRRIRSWLNTGAADPAARYGRQYTGDFEPDGNRITGHVASADGLVKYPPACVVALCEGTPICSTEQFERDHAGWRFTLDTADPITPNDILRDRISVIAFDHQDTRSTLKISGAIQLEILRAARGSTTEQELLITFTEDGNSRDYVREGWSGPERGHTWTNGKYSTLALPIAHPGARYRLEMLLWPFLVHGKLDGQTLLVSISDMLIAKFFPSQAQQLLEVEIPAEFTQSPEIIVRFDLPEAARPVDLGSGPDGRMLALAFRRLRLRRYHGDLAASP